MWILAGVVGGVILLEIVLHWRYGPIILRQFERKIPFNVEPAPAAPSAEAVSFPTTDGLTLRGSLHRSPGRGQAGSERDPLAPPSRALILFCPELGGNHWSAASYCQGLLEAGFDVLAFDFRNQGESDAMPGYDPLHWLTEYEIADVLAAIKYVRSRDDLRDRQLGLFGISRGGGAALAAAARCRDVDCVAGEGVFSNDSLFVHYTLRWAVLYAPAWLLWLLPLWHVKMTIALARRVSQYRRHCRYASLEKRLPRLRNLPTLLVAGQRDTYVHPELARQLSDGMGPGPHQLWVVPGARHNSARQTDPEAYDARLVEFFSQLSARQGAGKEISQQHG